ncbi:MAG: HD domain-containing protein [Candidatus Competibacteraceae bacterium]|nr:HD domain-containing protein [Candidatus Competibacteraceae bacterium]
MLGIDTYLVGGYVRDVLLGRHCNDIDIMSVGKGLDLAEKVAKRLQLADKLVVYKNFGTALIHHENLEIEFVGARKESYRANSRKPIVEDGSLEDDLSRRDFTINALAVKLNQKDFGKMIDLFDGLTHLQHGLLKTPLDPDITYSDDPLRMMRAIRFATQLHFRIDDNSLAAISANAERIKIVSSERIADELNKIILALRPSIGFSMLSETGLLRHIFPEMEELKGVEYIKGKGHKDNFWHTLQVLDNVATQSSNLWLRWASILHDIAKPATKKFEPIVGWTFHGHEELGARMVPRIFRKLSLPLNDKMKYVQKLVKLHLRPIALVKEEITDSAIRRLLFEAGDDIDDLMLLCSADITSKNEEKVKRYIKNFQLVQTKLQEVEEKDRIRNFQPPVTGELIMQTFGIGPCREIGILKNSVKDAILDGLIENDPQQAFQYMLSLAEQFGLKPIQP